MTSQLRRAWLATVVWFVINSIGYSSFLVRLPEIKDLIDASNTVLGLSIFVASLGALAAIKYGGQWSAKYGTSPVMVVSGLATAALFPVFGLLLNVLFFAASLFLVFLAISVVDVAMNAHAVTIEQQSGKTIMGRLHAMWSLGGISGGIIGGLFSAAKVSLFTHSLIVSALTFALVLFFKNYLLPADADKHEIDYSNPVKTKMPRIIYVLGFIGLCAAIMEGSASDWGAVLMNDEYGQSGFIASLPYIVFQTGMVAGRLTADSISKKIGRSRILFYSGFIAAIGLSFGLIVGGPIPTIFAWICIGIGASSVIPMAFSMAGTIANETGGIPASQAVARVSGIAYSAFFIGPPLIGVISDLSSLRVAMAIPAVLALGVAVGSRAIHIKD